MELQDRLLDAREIDNCKEKENVKLQEETFQYNRQDLDQEQKVDVNPVQLNTQNLHVIVNNDRNIYAGKISGTTYVESNKEIAQNVSISLYFGHECKLPVYKTNSDNNGNYVIEDIPPGYYTLCAEYKNILKYQSHYIKVFPCQIVYHPILLKL